MPSWFQQVSTTTIDDVVHRKQVLIEVEVSKSIESALQLMQEHDVTAVAVCQPLTDGGPRKIVYCGMEYIGIISVVDVFAYVIQHDVPFLEVLNRSVSEIIGMSEESANFWVEAPKNPLYFAMEKFIDHGSCAIKMCVSFEKYCRLPQSTCL
jgi:CBS domain-containing protein